MRKVATIRPKRMALTHCRSSISMMKGPREPQLSRARKHGTLFIGLEKFSQSEFPQGRAALLPVPFHALQNIIQRAYSLHDIGTLVEHHEFGAHPSRSISDFRTRWHSFLGEGLEHLSRPNDGDVRRFAYPENFFLHFRQPLITTFDGEIAARDHDSDSGAAHGRQEQGGQLLKRLPSLDLQDDAYILSSEPLQSRLKIENVRLSTHKRITQHVRMFRDKVQRADVVCSERRNSQLTFGKVDALLGPQSAAFGARLHDLDRDLVVVDRPYHSADRPIIQLDLLADSHVVK